MKTKAGVKVLVFLLFKYESCFIGCSMGSVSISMREM